MTPLENIELVFPAEVSGGLVSQGRIIGNNGIPLSMFDSYDNIPMEIRGVIMRLDDALRAAPSSDLSNEVRNIYSNLLSDIGSALQIENGVNNLIEYIEYLCELLTPVRMRRKSSQQEIANKPDKRSKLFAPIGIEFAYHPPTQNKKNKNDSNFNFSDSGSNTILIDNISDYINTAIQNETQIQLNAITAVSQMNSDFDISGSWVSIGSSGSDDTPVEEDPSYEPSNDEQPAEEPDLPYDPNLPYDSNCNCGPEEGCGVCSRRYTRTEGRRRNSVDSYFYTNKLCKLLEEADLMNGYGMRVYKDGGTVEVCTPILKNWKSLMDWFSKCDAIAKDYGYMPWRKKAGGGGMHINISYNKTVPNWRLAYTNFFVMIANLPQLNWIFNEPGDNHTANALVRNERFIKAYSIIQQENGVSDKAWRDISVCGGKSWAINCKDQYHFEVRTFEMVRSPQEFHDVLNLINTLLGFCMEVAEWNVLIPLDVEIPRQYMDDAEIRGYMLPSDSTQPYVFAGLMWSGEAKFNQLVRDLGLDPKVYRKYVRRNYYARRAYPYGKKFMV